LVVAVATVGVTLVGTETEAGRPTAANVESGTLMLASK
jgi:hypothetical protein